MKKLFTVLASICTSLVGFSQNPHCDSLEIVDIGLNPLDPTELLLYVENHNELEFFSYPNFKLLNANNDTVASETPNFFGIGQTSLHNLGTYSSGIDPTEVFNGTLLLYIWFEDSLACSFPVSETFVTDTGCLQFYISTTDYIDTVDQVLNWSITDEEENVVVSGSHDHTLSDLTLQDTVCLDNGCYTLHINTTDGPLDGNSDVMIYYAGYWLSMGQQMQTGANQMDLDFNVYFCDSTTVGIKQNPDFVDVSLSPNPTKDFINMGWQHPTTFQSVQVIDMSGRVLITEPIQNKAFHRMDIRGLANGIYLFRFKGNLGEVMYKKVIKG